jgi:hypothetical protein
VNSRKNQKPDPRELIAQAEQAASRKSIDEALELFNKCICDYLRRNLIFRAIAVAKRARTILGPIPKVRALIIRLYRSTGLHGDARDEYLLAKSFLKKDEVPIFRTLDEEAFIALLSMVEIVPVLKGRTILKQQQKGDEVYVVLSGALEVLRDSKRLGTMIQGDVFGELGFFCKGERSATVKAREKSMLVRIPSASIRELRQNYPDFDRTLEEIYEERVMKKAQEDIGNPLPESIRPDIVATLHYPKGNEIPLNDHHAVAVIKHGVVEIDYENMKLRRKEYLKAGSVIPKGLGRAWASTNVVILLTGISHGQETEIKK